MSCARGFTLLEVMVALAVFAIVSVALVGNASSSLRQAGAIRDHTVAWWLAENHMTSLRIQPRTEENFPRAGTGREVIEMDEGAWEIETRVETTENDFVRRITVAVYREQAEDPVAELTGVLGRH